MVNKMSTEVYIFDCDGVIINSGDDIADCVNHTLKNFGYWTVPTKTLISFVGDGTKKLLLRALDFSAKGKFNINLDYDAKKFEEILEFYQNYYYEHPVVKTYLYVGIKDLLFKLKEKGKKTALLTNKPAKIANQILKHFEILDLFDFVTGPDTLNEDGKKIKLKPESEGLIFTLNLINKKYCTTYKNENCIMIGDSAQDIQAGKNFGCKTVACRSGLGDTKKLLAENPDFSFSVAAELERFIDFLSKDSISNLKEQAMHSEVPIIEDEGSNFICTYIKENSVKSILELGTAIGYSSIKFAKLSPDIKVTTIEIDKERFDTACKNFKSSGVENQITAVFADALEYDTQEKFDLIFIDAAKAQYIKFFEKYKKNLSEKGVFISDNLSFHGMVEDLSLTRNYSTVKLVKKIRKYIDFLKNNAEFSTEFFKIGDGIALSRKNQ
ncbi:HAD hydrolase-like protein [Treponema pectinovorum]|uniref:HAD hydrolase-like protein n=1 Tax=Treponema pectinovorum TaxID=164 RepID=UPI003D8C39AC